MDDHRQLQLDGEPNLLAERALLHVVRHVLPVVIEADLANGYDLRMRGKFAECVDRPFVERVGVARVDTHRGVDFGVSLGKLDDATTRIHGDAGIDDESDARVPRALDDFVAVGVELFEIEMSMCIDEHVSVRFCVVSRSGVAIQ